MWVLELNLKKGGWEKHTDELVPYKHAKGTLAVVINPNTSNQSYCVDSGECEHDKFCSTEKCDPKKHKVK